MSGRQALSITLHVDNITWLKGRTGAGGARSVSDLVDQLVTAARQSGNVGPTRSVAGTVDIDPSDPTLEAADAAVRELYEFSLRRPLVAREESPAYGRRSSARRPRLKQRG